MPSDTPLTDSQLLNIEGGHTYASKPDSEEMITEIVPAEFARKLERENAELKRDLAFRMEMIGRLREDLKEARA